MKKILILLLTMAFVASGCSSTGSTNEEAIELLSKAVDNIEKAHNYTFTGTDKYEGAFFENVNNDTSGKKAEKDNTYYNLIRTENQTTRNNGYIDVTIQKQIPKDNYYMTIFASEYPEGFLLQHIMPNSSVTSSDIAYSNTSILSTLQNGFYFQDKKMKKFFDINIKQEGKNKTITLKVKDTKKLDEERIKDGKKQDPNYNHYMVFDQKVRKKETKKYEAEFILDQDNNLRSQKIIVFIDYGDGLKYDSENVTLYSDINTTTIDTNAIDALCEQAKDPVAILSKMTWVNSIK